MENNFTLSVGLPDKVQLPSASEILQDLESSDVPRKVAALKKSIMLIQSGEEIPKLLFSVIRFCINCEDHTLQKLLMLFYECVRKYDSAGKFLPEMILVTNALRNNLIHPNEYIRGTTLRFLSKLKEPEILEPLIPTIRQCLTHRHPYVRRNAVLTAYSIVRQFPDMYTDAVEDITKLIEEETDSGTRRNAFVMLFNCSQIHAMDFLAKNHERATSFGDGFALILLDLIRKVSIGTGSGANFTPPRADVKARFIRLVFSLLNNTSSAVSYEAAGTLLSLSGAPTAARSAAQAYTRILLKETDNNVRMIVLDRLSALRRRHAKVLREQIFEIIRVLQTPNMEIRSRVLSLVSNLITPRNVDAVVAVLRKEIAATLSVDSHARSDSEHVRFRVQLVTAIHSCLLRFPETVPVVVPVLCDFLTDEAAPSVVDFIREILEQHPQLNSQVLARLRAALPEISLPNVLRSVLWMLGEYSQDQSSATEAFHAIREALGPLPLALTFEEYKARVSSSESVPASEETPSTSSKVQVLADGTYASQSAAQFSSSSKDTDSSELISPLRQLLLRGDFFLGAVISATLTKLSLVCSSNGHLVDSLLVIQAIMELGVSGNANTPELLPSTVGSAPLPEGSNSRSGTVSSQPIVIDQDSFERMVQCVHILGHLNSSASDLRKVVLESSRAALRRSIAVGRAKAQRAARDGAELVGGGTLSTAQEPEEDEEKFVVPVNTVPLFRQLVAGSQPSADLEALAIAEDWNAGSSGASSASVPAVKGKEGLAALLPPPPTVMQLTGLGDPLYAEAQLQVHAYDVILSLTIINRTGRTLPSVWVELSTLGEVKIMDRLPALTLAPGESRVVKLSLKVSSLETGHIFGSLVSGDGGTGVVGLQNGFAAVPTPALTAGGQGAGHPNNANGEFGIVGAQNFIVHLAEIHIDILEYLKPASCSDGQFRRLWSEWEFEWENKVSVVTNITDLHEFVQHVAKVTNMRVLTNIWEMPQGSSFLAANLAARSIFGEDALANICVEHRPDGSIKGHVRIRAKTQGVALALGDRITAKQRA